MNPQPKNTGAQIAETQNVKPKPTTYPAIERVEYGYSIGDIFWNAECRVTRIVSPSTFVGRGVVPGKPSYDHVGAFHTVKSDAFKCGVAVVVIAYMVNPRPGKVYERRNPAMRLQRVK